MSILLNGEILIPLAEVADLWSEKLAPDAPRLWATRGIRGIHLETVRIGPSLMTSREAVRRFSAALDLDTDARREA